MKEFYEKWSQDEIDEWVDIYNVLIVFEATWATREVKLIFHGNMSGEQKGRLAETITRHFGGVSMTKALCDKINEFAQKWYNKMILKKKARVLNSKKRKK